MWRYIKGSESDFEGAPTNMAFKLRAADGSLIFSNYENGMSIRGQLNDMEVIAQRERVTSINDDRLAHDMVNHPKHYTQGGIECIDAIKAATVGKSGIEAVCVANVVKYLWRYEEKNGVEDVKKARWYLERLIQEMGE